MNKADIDTSFDGDTADGQDNVLIKVEREDVIRRLSWRVKRSTSFLVIYIIIILTNLFILAWEITGSASWIVTTILGALINLVFLIEVTVEMITQDQYFRKCWNVIDFVICVLCILSFIVFCIYDSVVGDEESSNFFTFKSVETLTYGDEEDLGSLDDDDDIDIGDSKSIPIDMSDVDMVLLLVRYIVQSIRLCRFMATAAKRNTVQELEEDIQFPDKEAEDYPMTHGRTEYVNYDTINTKVMEVQI